MLDILLWSLVFIASVAVLIKSADYFTELAEKIGISFGMSPFVVGVTIVAFGTSLPELVSAIIAILANNPEIVPGMVIGSNISNILLIVGLSALVARKSIKVKYDIFKFDMPVFVFSAIILAIFIYNGIFSMIEGIVFILIGISYVYLTTRKRQGLHEEVSHIKPVKINMKNIAMLLLAGFFIWLGAKYTVESAVRLSMIFGIAVEVIALSAVALGTSLPELAVSVTAARKNRESIAIGNIIGSNIFNIFFVMGVPSLIASIPIPQSLVSFALPVMLIATGLLFFMAIDRKITKLEGAVLLLLYFFFTFRLFF